MCVDLSNQLAGTPQPQSCAVGGSPPQACATSSGSHPQPHRPPHQACLDRRRPRVLEPGNGSASSLAQSANLYYKMDFAQLLFQQILVQNGTAGLASDTSLRCYLLCWVSQISSIASVQTPCTHAVHSFLFQTLAFVQKVFTNCKCTNAVLATTASFSDDAQSAAQVKLLAAWLPAKTFRQLEYVSMDNVDNPFQALYLRTLKAICINLQTMALDPVHLSMTCEHAPSLKRMHKAQRRVLKVQRCQGSPNETSIAGA